MFNNSNAKHRHGLKVSPTAVTDSKRSDSGLSSSYICKPGGGDGRSVDLSDKSQRIPGMVVDLALQKPKPLNPGSYDTVDRVSYVDKNRDSAKMALNTSIGAPAGNSILTATPEVPIYRADPGGSPDLTSAMESSGWALPAMLLWVGVGAVVLYLIFKAS
jgi:hypothetical protein